MTEQRDDSNPGESGRIKVPGLVKFPGQEFGGPEENNPLHKPARLLDMKTPEGRAEAERAISEMRTFLDSLGMIAGLAGPQVEGVDVNVIICPEPPETLPPPPDWKPTLKSYINSRILRVTKERVLRREACLSGKKVTGETMSYEVERPAGMEIEFENPDGTTDTRTMIGPLADIMWQEVDHVFGRTIDNTKGTIPNSGTTFNSPAEFGPAAKEYKGKYPVPENPTWISYEEYTAAPDITLVPNL